MMLNGTVGPRTRGWRAGKAVVLVGSGLVAEVRTWTDSIAAKAIRPRKAVERDCTILVGARETSQASRRTARSEHRSARRRLDSGAKGPPTHPVPPMSLEER